MLQPIVTDLKELAANTAELYGFDLCGLQLLTHQIPMTMQLQIRHLDGRDVSLEDCASFSSHIGEALDTSELINDAYVLEVSSPGIGEQLVSDRDFQTFRGFPVEVLFRDKKGSQLSRNGLLHERSNNHVHLNIKGRMSRIPREDVLGVRLTSPTG